MPKRFSTLVVSRYEGKPIADILNAPPSAIQGVSEADASALASAFGITTVARMARSTPYERARALLAASGVPAFDPGPPLDFAALFAEAPISAYEQHPSGRFRLEFGPVYYRGRLDGSARALILGQDPSTDELLAQRAFVGHSGQRLQFFLRKIGLTRSYVMVNTFLYGIRGQFDAEMRTIMTEPSVRDYRHRVLDRLAACSDFEVVLTIGKAAREAIALWPASAQFAVFHLTHPAADDALIVSDWNEHLPEIIAAVTPDEGIQPDPTPYEAPLGDEIRIPVPREDLPFGVPVWHGATSTASKRDGDKQIIWRAP